MENDRSELRCGRKITWEECERGRERERDGGREVGSLDRGKDSFWMKGRCVAEWPVTKSEKEAKIFLVLWKNTG